MDDMKYYIIPEQHLYDWFDDNPDKYESYLTILDELKEDYIGGFENEYDTFKKNYCFFFLFKKHELLGFLIFSDLINCKPLNLFNLENHIYITDCSTNKKYQRQGICSNLLKQLFIIFENNKFMLTVDKINFAALDCYTKNGFNIILQIDDYYYMIKN